MGVEVRGSSLHQRTLNARDLCGQLATSVRMPIGNSSRSKKAAPAHLPSSSTQFVAARPKPTNQAAVVVPADQRPENDALPTYDEATTEESDLPNKQVPPTPEQDLHYFAAKASNTPAQITPTSSRLVLHLFRTTQTHIFPVEERLALGTTSTYPFYALRAALGMGSVDEYNKLTLTRRWPGTDVWQPVAVSEVTPRLKLMAQGQMMISRIRLGQHSNVNNGPDNSFEVWWDSRAGSYTIWRSKISTELEICCEGWSSLDEVPRTGHLVVSVQFLHFSHTIFVLMSRSRSRIGQRHAMKATTFLPCWTSMCLLHNLSVSPLPVT